MKRDMELVRKILLRVEKEEGLAPLERKYGTDTVVGHVSILRDGGLIDALMTKDGGGNVSVMALFRLTWKGHEFVDNARDEALWKSVTKALGEKVESVSFSVLSKCLKKAILERVGFDK